MKHLVKVSWHKNQCRVTLPKSLVDEMQWRKVDYVIIEGIRPDGILVRRFVDVESLKNEGCRTFSGPY